MSFLSERGLGSSLAGTYGAEEAGLHVGSPGVVVNQGLFGGPF